jgi:DTW domain-containing protein YfiP
MPEGLCVCELIPALTSTTRVILIMHSKEVGRPSNTGRFAALALDRCEVRLRGRPHAPLDTDGIEPDALLLYPDDELSEHPPIPLTELAGAAPTMLLVPDGTWGQARRMVRREPLLRAARRVTLPGGAEGPRIRRDVFPHRMSTLEAIAIALGVLESPALEAALRDLHRTVAERTLWARGALPEAAVRSGIPAGAKRW